MDRTNGAFSEGRRRADELEEAVGSKDFDDDDRFDASNPRDGRSVAEELDACKTPLMRLGKEATSNRGTDVDCLKTLARGAEGLEEAVGGEGFDDDDRFDASDPSDQGMGSEGLEAASPSLRDSTAST